MGRTINKASLIKSEFAKNLYLAGDPGAAQNAYLQLLKSTRYNADLLALIVNDLIEAGAREFALNLLIEALQSTKPTVMLLNVIGQLAQKLNTHDVAIKIFRAALNMNADQPSCYVNIANSQYLIGEIDAASETTQQALHFFPEHAPLWNMLGTILLHGKNDHENALKFYQEAARLDPVSDVYLTNLANFYGTLPEGTELYKKAIKINSQNHEAHVGLGINYLAQGELKKGWRHKEHRLLMDSMTSKKARPELPAPLWKGESLVGKSVFVIAEQGLGDEIFYSLTLRQLTEVTDRICISCDPRLKGLFERSFPFAHVVPYEDTVADGFISRRFPGIDAAPFRPEVSIWAASLPSIFWPELASIPQISATPFKPDPVQVDQYANAIKPGAKLKVGLAWRSGKQAFGRDRAYYGPNLAGYIVRWFKNDVDFYNLQYGCNEEELNIISDIAETGIHTFEGVDIKQDIEGNYAILKNLDALITPATATAMFGLTSGIRTYMINSGPPWWTFGQDLQPSPPFAPNLKWFFREAEERYAYTIRRMLNEFKRDFDLETVF